MTLSTASREDQRLARMATGAPRVPWDDFKGGLFRWEHGEHIGMLGPTGQGKTTLLRHLMPMHPYSTVFITKPRDKSANAFLRDGYQKLDRWRSVDPKDVPRRILWPDASGLYAMTRQQEVFGDAMDRIYREGAWTVAVDELWYVANRLKLGAEVKTYLTQARSLDISMVNMTQRPSWVPTEMYDQSTHLFIWRNNDGRAQDRLGEINAVDHDLVKGVVQTLEPHQVLYINTRTGEMARTRCPAIAEGR